VMELEYTQENYAALVISILMECSPEQAFRRLNKKFRRHRVLEQMDIEEMKKLRTEGRQLKEIAEIYGVVISTVSYHLKKLN